METTSRDRALDILKDIRSRQTVTDQEEIKMNAELQTKVLEKFTLDEIILKAILVGIDDCHLWGRESAEGLNICNSREIAEQLCEKMLEEGKDE